jgi:TFIIF-interacting CTD phosphatase-like protein
MFFTKVSALVIQECSSEGIDQVHTADNAVPIEGWISDPTDNGLLHLIPLLEGLQYATDVRAVLSLRLGQPQAA